MSTERLRRETSQCDVLWKTWPYDDKFSFLYMNMDKALKNSTQGKVAYIWQIEWLQIDVIKFERMQIHFFSDVFTAIVILVAFKASIGAIQLTKWMQIFFDTGAKFHEFLLRCGMQEKASYMTTYWATKE